jgi:hypothetical protein
MMKMSSSIVSFSLRAKFLFLKKVYYFLFILFELYFFLNTWLDEFFPNKISCFIQIISVYKNKTDMALMWL